MGPWFLAKTILLERNTDEHLRKRHFNFLLNTKRKYSYFKSLLIIKLRSKGPICNRLFKEPNSLCWTELIIVNGKSACENYLHFSKQWNRIEILLFSIYSNASICVYWIEKNIVYGITSTILKYLNIEANVI